MDRVVRHAHVHSVHDALGSQWWRLLFIHGACPRGSRWLARQSHRGCCHQLPGIRLDGAAIHRRNGVGRRACAAVWCFFFTCQGTPVWYSRQRRTSLVLPDGATDLSRCAANCKRFVARVAHLLGRQSAHSALRPRPSSPLYSLLRRQRCVALGRRVRYTHST